MLKLWRPLRKIGRWIGRIWSNVKWLIIGLSLLGSFIFGFWGVNSAGEKQCSVQKLLTNCPPLIYETLQLITMDGDTKDINWQMDVSIVLAFFTIILTGWETFAFLFRDQWRKIYLSWLIKEHIIICGLGQKGFLFAKSFLESGQEVVVIEEKKDNSLITKCEDEGGIVLIGNATSQDMLKRSAVQRARYLIAVCGDDDINFEIAMFAKAITADRRYGRLTCMNHTTIPDADFYFWQKEIPGYDKATFELVMFDVFREGARILLHECETFNSVDGIPGDNPPHLLIIGGGKLAESLVLQAAAQWSYKDNQTSPLVISMVAPQIEEKKNKIEAGLPPSARDGSIFKLEPVEGGDMHPSTIRKAVETHLKLEKPETKLMVYVCMDDDSQGLLTGVTLSRTYPRGSIEKVIVRMKEDAEFELSGYGETETVKSFGLLEKICTAELIEHGYDEHIARALHRKDIQKRNVNKADSCQWNKLHLYRQGYFRGQAKALRREIDRQNNGYYLGTATSWEKHGINIREELLQRLGLSRNDLKDILNDLLLQERVQIYPRKEN